VATDWHFRVDTATDGQFIYRDSRNMPRWRWGIASVFAGASCAGWQAGALVHSQSFVALAPARSSSSSCLFLGGAVLPDCGLQSRSTGRLRTVPVHLAAGSETGAGGTPPNVADLATRSKLASSIPAAKKTGTDPAMMELEQYDMFPKPPDAAAADVDFEETVHSGGLALLTLYHQAKRESALVSPAFLQQQHPSTSTSTAHRACPCICKYNPDGVHCAGPVIAHYWYKSCAMCKLMKPVIQRVVREYDGKIHYVDVEISLNKKTMSHAGVRSIPAVQVFMDGKVRIKNAHLPCPPLRAIS